MKYDFTSILDRHGKDAIAVDAIGSGEGMAPGAPKEGFDAIPRFHVDNNDMVVEKDIHFYSFCEHHMLPFYGTAAIAYIPDGEVVGLSKMARTVEVYAKRFQLQERLSAQIADAFMQELNPKGVMVLIEAEHMCMTMRGIKKPGTKTVTAVTRGVFDNNEELQNRFFRMIERR